MPNYHLGNRTKFTNQRLTRENGKVYKQEISPLESISCTIDSKCNQLFQPLSTMSLKSFFSPLVSSFLSNPITNWANTIFQDIVVNILKSGPVPNHVAFIMDGNRRYARAKGMETFKGHEAGSASLASIIEACHKLNIEFVTIYAFSIENFNRSPDEVEKIFEILVEKLNTFLDHEKDYNKFVQIRIIGNRKFIPQETLKKLEKIERLTSVNHRLILNVCFAYTSRDEITHSIGNTVEKVLNQVITASQINNQILNDNFYFHPDTPPVDILIRTSGHTRLSDFLIWQVNENSTIEFINVYWPEFTSIQYYFILLKWSYLKNLNLKFNKLNELYDNTTTKSIDLKNLPPPPPFVSILGEKKSKTT